MLLFSQTSMVTPDFFFQVFAKNRLIKKIFEEEKKFYSGTWIFLKIVQY